MDYKSKVGYSLEFKKKEIFYFLIASIVVILLLMLLLPAPVNYFLAFVALILEIIFLGLGLLIMKFILGVVVEVNNKNIKIFKFDSLTLKPENNQILFAFGRNFHASCNILKNNIHSIRKIEDKEELKAIKKADNVFKIFKVAGFLGFSLNKNSMEKISFLTDYKNCVEITTKKIQLKYPGIDNSQINFLTSHILNLNNFKILVSVKNPDLFIKSVKS